MRVTTRTNLAIRALMVCAVNPHRVVRKHEIAAACNSSENHLAQVVNTLSQLGFIETHRGRAGGMKLAMPMQDIGVGAVFRAFETGIPFAECFDPGANTCPLISACRLRDALEVALAAFHHALDGITLGELVQDNAELERILCLGERSEPALCRTPKPASNRVTARI